MEVYLPVNDDSGQNLFLVIRILCSNLYFSVPTYHEHFSPSRFLIVLELQVCKIKCLMKIKIQPIHTCETPAEAVLEGKLIKLNADFKKEENSQVN